MKILSLLLAFSLSSAALASDYPYSFKSVPHSEIDQYLVPGSDATATPENLQGLWFMDGNPLPDEVISFAGAVFTPMTDRDGAVVGFEAFIPVFDEGGWSWHDTTPGHLLYSAVRRVKLVYHAVFNPEFTHGDITPVIQPLANLSVPALEIPQSMLVNFSMNQVNADEYSRDSVLFGLPSSYRFRRIVDGNGNRLASYQDYVDSINRRGLKNAWLPVCKSNTNTSLPTSCAN